MTSLIIGLKIFYDLCVKLNSFKLNERLIGTNPESRTSSSLAADNEMVPILPKKMRKTIF